MVIYILNQATVVICWTILKVRKKNLLKKDKPAGILHFKWFNIVKQNNKKTIILYVCILYNNAPVP